MLSFLRVIIAFFNEKRISYMLSGSVAMSVYVVPRATRDFDFVVELEEDQAHDLANYFKANYYCDEDAVVDAIRFKSIFNIIDPSSGYKADFIILKSSQYRQTEFERRKAIDFEGMKLFIVTREDLLLSKLIWIQELQSEIQKSDIQQLAKGDTIDWQYIRYWIKELNLITFDLV